MIVIEAHLKRLIFKEHLLMREVAGPVLQLTRAQDNIDEEVFRVETIIGPEFAEAEAAHSQVDEKVPDLRSCRSVVVDVVQTADWVGPFTGEPLEDKVDSRVAEFRDAADVSKNEDGANIDIGDGDFAVWEKS